MEDEFTGRETERQDCVDNAIADLITELIPDDCPFDWDIELIGNVRDAIKEVIVDKMGAMTEQEFYPYRELKPSESKAFEFPENTIFVDDSQLTGALIAMFDTMDGDDLCSIAEQWLGGQVWLTPNGYAFIPNEWYIGAFDYLKKKEK